MAMAFRPRLSPSSMSSRYGSLALGDGFGRLGSSGLPEADPPESVVTPMAGFAGAQRPHPGGHTSSFRPSVSS